MRWVSDSGLWDRVVWSFSTSPPCHGFCCLFAALRSKAPLSWVLGRRKAALGASAPGWALKIWAKLCPQNWPLGQASVGISGYSMARLALLIAGVVISFLWAPFCSQSKAPHCQASCPARALLQDGTGSCYCHKNKREAEGKNNYNKNPPFFPY